MDEILENQEDTAVAETAPEQGTVSDDKVDTTQVETEPVVEAELTKDEQKAQMRENQIKNTEAQARELEKATGLKLEDLIATLNSAEPVVEQPQVEQQNDDVDMERFAELTDLAVKAKYGDKFARLDRMDEYFAKLDAKEAVSQLPADYKEYEADMMDFISKNKDIMKTNDGVMTAYYAAKGKNLDKIVQSAEKNTTAKLNETEEVKKVAFIENAKSSGKEQRAATLQDLANLSLADLAKIPKEEREKVLRALSS